MVSHIKNRWKHKKCWWNLKFLWRKNNFKKSKINNFLFFSHKMNQLLTLLLTLFAKVSWVRHRDIHILTAGAYTYTSDQRFQALHRQNTGQNSEWSEWTLCIKWAQERDQGIYECQISTIPVKAHQFHLNVVGEFYTCYNLNSHRRSCSLFITNKFLKY